jgi:hypothetical protein
MSAMPGTVRFSSFSGEQDGLLPLWPFLPFIQSISVQSIQRAHDDNPRTPQCPKGRNLGEEYYADDDSVEEAKIFHGGNGCRLADLT